MASGSFRDDMRALLHDRILDAAWEITTTSGWSSVTMGAVAARAGISRQHLYHGIGSKQDLADALIARETDGFLQVVVEQLRAHPTDPVAGFDAAVRHALAHGSQNALLKAIVAGVDQRGESLLPLLAVRPEPVLERAIRTVRVEAGRLYQDRCNASPGALDVHADAVARLVLSHLTQPGPPDRAVEQARWLTRAAFTEP